MGRTYRGERKRHGVTKTKHHKQRAKWKGKNGTRLRTLAVDLLDFQQEAGEGAVPIHALSKSSKESSVRKVDSTRSRNPLYSFLVGLSVESLRIRRDYAKKQMSHVQRTVSVVTNTFGKGYNKALSARQAHWSCVINKTGELLQEREKCSLYVEKT